MSRKKGFHYFFAVAASVIMIGSTAYGQSASTGERPFECVLNEVRINDEKRTYLTDSGPVASDEPERRLILSWTISNTTEEDFRDVWYEAELNKEAEPFIGSGILSFESDHLDVTSRDNALSDEASREVWGFEHESDILLTSEELLEEYFGLHQDQLFDYLRELKITIYWEGGSQVETLRISGESYCEPRRGLVPTPRLAVFVSVLCHFFTRTVTFSSPNRRINAGSV